MRKPRVLLLFGGRSSEHEVSLMSARSVLAAIDRERYEVVTVGISPNGHWRWFDDPEPVLAAGSVPDTGLGRPFTISPDPGEKPPFDVVFPLLHGPYGEDGTIQGLLELANLPYVGAGVLSSALAMDKGVMKDLMSRSGVPTPEYRVVTQPQWQRRPDETVAALVEALGFPMFVKPANQGSSVGVHGCADEAALRAGIVDAFRYDRRIVVERAVPNVRELEISVLGNDDVEVSVPGEIIPAGDFYDYRSKYIDPASKLLIPAPVSARVVAQCRELAERVYRMIDCSGLARVDFLLDDKTQTLYVNEVNTMPGFTQISMYPKLWEACGLSYPDLIDRLIQLAFDRWQKRRALATRYLP